MTALWKDGFFCPIREDLKKMVDPSLLNIMLMNVNWSWIMELENGNVFCLILVYLRIMVRMNSSSCRNIIWSINTTLGFTWLMMWRCNWYGHRIIRHCLFMIRKQIRYLSSGRNLNKKVEKHYILVIKENLFDYMWRKVRLKNEHILPSNKQIKRLIPRIGIFWWCRCHNLIHFLWITCRYVSIHHQHASHSRREW